MRVNCERKLNLIKQRNLIIYVRNKINFKEIHIYESKQREETLREANKKNNEKKLIVLTFIAIYFINKYKTNAGRIEIKNPSYLFPSSFFRQINRKETTIPRYI